MKEVKLTYDFVVVGGGMSGVCAALAAARNGAKTVLVHNRPVLGGNASSEVRISINGGGRVKGFQNAMESGVILEILMRNKKVNPQYSFNVLDHVIWEKVTAQENLDLFLNTSMTKAHVVDHKITAVEAYQSTSATTFTFEGTIFADGTGDGNLAFESGADFTIGREAKSTYNESVGPEVADHHTMGSTILFTTKDMGKPYSFKRPEWAYEITKEIIGDRNVHELSNGYWWCEVGGDDLSTIDDAEEIRDELLKYAYGIFDYIKNSGRYPEAANLMLDWFGAVPGKRESRRILGDYVLNQNDIEAAARFPDTIAYGGWSMDDHTVGGIRAKGHDKEGDGSIWHAVTDVYTIPYGCIYSRNIENLYVGGRALSVSHMAMSSTRVIGTCSSIGQGIGTAAAVAIKHGVMPRGVQAHMHELQQTLLKDDAYLPGIAIEDTEDLIANTDCTLTATSSIEGAGAEMANSAFTRRIYEVENTWISEEMRPEGEALTVAFAKPTTCSQICYRFDPNLNRTIATSIAQIHRDLQVEEMPYELARDYKVECFLNGELVKEIIVEDNYQRVNKHAVDAVVCDTIKTTILKTYGDKHARICDIRVY